MRVGASPGGLVPNAAYGTDDVNSVIEAYQRQLDVIEVELKDSIRIAQHLLEHAADTQAAGSFYSQSMVPGSNQIDRGEQDDVVNPDALENSLLDLDDSLELSGLLEDPHKFGDF